MTKDICRAPARYTSTGSSKMEARVTFNEYNKGLLDLPDPRNPLNSIGNIDRLNELLEDKDFIQKYEQALTITFGRAPIDGPHSMGTAIIKQFFEPTSGSILQLPEEFIKASSIDFDIDKEKVYFSYLTGFELEKVEKDIKALEDEYEELRKYADEYRDIDEYNDENVDAFFNSVFQRRLELNPNNSVYDADNEIYDAYRRYLKLKKEQSYIQVNKLLGIFEKVLRLPEMYIDTVLPNSAAGVNDIAEKNGVDVAKQSQQEKSPNQIPKLSEVLDAKQNLNVFNMFMSAKRLLGVFALSNNSE